jgi:hypothetical protein
MTKTTFTRQQIADSFHEISDLGALMRALESKFLEQGEVVCQFHLNGMKITENDEKRLSQIPLGEVETIEIESENPQALLFGLIENWIAELPTLVRNADELAQEIKFKGIEGRLKAFVDLIDSCQFLTESLISLEGIVKSPAIDQVQWRKAEQLTARAIGQGIKSFEAKDFVLLSEILEYDLAHALQVWLEQIQTLGQLLKEESARDTKGFSARIFNKGTSS